MFALLLLDHCAAVAVDGDAAAACWNRTPDRCCFVLFFFFSVLSVWNTQNNSHMYCVLDRESIFEHSLSLSLLIRLKGIGVKFVSDH